MTCKMRRTLITALLLLAFPLLLLRLAGAQTAAPDPIVQIPPAQAATFSSAFTALAQQAHVMVVAEDQPLHSALTPRAAAELKLNKDSEPLSTLLPRLAAAYDYDVQPSGAVFLLKKRYTDAADLPSVTVKECAIALEETNRYAENFNPHLVLGLPDRSPAIHDLIYSLTPQQLEAMKDIHRGVLVASLVPVQQQEVWQFLMHMYVQTAITGLPRTIGFLNRVFATDPRFSWRDLAHLDPLLARFDPQVNAHLFGYDTTRADGKPLFMTMSKPDQVKVRLDGGVMIRFRPHVTNRLAEAPPALDPPEIDQIEPGDVTDPLPVPANAPPPAPPVSSSLGDILTRLNAHIAGDPKGDGLKVTVESYLAPKQATVFGEATPRQEVAALAGVYGLRVLTEEKEDGKDRLRLTRLSPTATLDAAALHDVVGQFLPDPLVRAYRMHPTYGAFDPNAPVSPIPYGISPLLAYAVRQIRTAAEPKIRASKDGHAALSALSEREGRAFAVVLMVDPMDSLIRMLPAAPPKEITRFNEVRLSGGLYDDKQGKKRLTLLLALPHPNDPSTLQQGMGVGEIVYDPINHTH